MSDEGKELHFRDKYQEEIDRRCRNYEETKDGYKCKKCGSTVMQTTIYVSIYMKEFGGGFGDVRNLPFPYCPKCEGKPEIVRGHT